MPKYRVHVTQEISRRSVYEVEAASEEEAEDIWDDVGKCITEYDKNIDSDSWIEEVK